MSSPKFESDEFESDDLNAIEPLDSQDHELSETDPSEIGKTSAESERGSGSLGRETGDDETDKRKYELSLYDVLLLISLVCVTLATILMFLALGEYGNIFTSYPWRV